MTGRTKTSVELVGCWLCCQHATRSNKASRNQYVWSSSNLLSFQQHTTCSDCWFQWTASSLDIPGFHTYQSAPCKPNFLSLSVFLWFCIMPLQHFAKCMLAVKK